MTSVSQNDCDEHIEHFTQHAKLLHHHALFDADKAMRLQPPSPARRPRAPRASRTPAPWISSIWPCRMLKSSS